MGMGNLGNVGNDLNLASLLRLPRLPFVFGGLRPAVPTLVCKDGNVLKFIKEDAKYLLANSSEYSPA